MYLHFQSVNWNVWTRKNPVFLCIWCHIRFCDINKVTKIVKTIVSANQNELGPNVKVGCILPTACSQNYGN